MTGGGHPDGVELVKRLEAEWERKSVEGSGQLDLFGTNGGA